MNKINVLSLFDGVSCGQIALNEAGFEIKKYFASEVDKFAIKSAQSIFPNTIQIGDVINVKGTDYGFIHILHGGSPCQSFSFAGKQKGMSTIDNIEILSLEHYLELKSKNFEFEGQSYLFWEYVRILKEVRTINPNVYFLLENVEMSKKWENVITRAIGVRPIAINSKLLSAQSRPRLYWTNIYNFPDGLFGEMLCKIPQPKDKAILLKHILKKDVDEKYFLSDKMLNYFKKRASNFNNGVVNIREENGKASCLTKSMASCDISDNFIKIDTNLNISANQDKANCFTDGGNSGGLHSDMTLIAENSFCLSYNRSEEAKKLRRQGIDRFENKQLEPRFDGKTNCLTSVQKDNLVLIQNGHGFNKGGVFEDKSPTLTSNSWEHNNHILIPEATKKGFTEIQPGDCFGFENINSKTRRGRKMEDKSNCLMAQDTNFMHYTNDFRIRRLTPKEAFRLQTFPEDIIDKLLNCGVSDSQLYKQAGNGWTVEVIKYIYSFIDKSKL